MDSNYTLGYYGKNVFTSEKDRLEELTYDKLFWLLNKIPKSPCKKSENKGDYDSFKQTKLPFLFFTRRNKRPLADDKTISPSGFASIDIDHTEKEYTISHPSVMAVYHSGGGTHIIVHGVYGDTPLEWTKSYTDVAYEVWNELKSQDSSIRFDGSSAKHTQGTLLWNEGDWVMNTNYDHQYKPEHHVLTKEQVYEVFDEKYPKKQSDTFYNAAAKIGKRETKKVDFEDSAMEIGQMLKISEEMLAKFFSLGYASFLREYNYSPIIGDTPEFTEYTDYLGNKYAMCKTNGELIKLWQPIMQDKRSLSNDNEGKRSYKIKDGGRTYSIWSHAVQACQYLTKRNIMNPDHVLYDSVRWVYYLCEKGYEYPKNKLISEVFSAFRQFKYKDDCSRYDKRSFISGQYRYEIDEETGEIIPIKMKKGEKISANSKCRVTERMREILDKWNPNESIESNAERLSSYGDLCSGLKLKTFTNYLKKAKEAGMDKQYRWLDDIEISKRSGRKSQSLTIVNIESGDEFVFGSKKDCMVFLGCSSRTFKKFLEGKSKLNKVWSFKSKNN